MDNESIWFKLFYKIKNQDFKLDIVLNSFNLNL